MIWPLKAITSPCIFCHFQVGASIITDDCHSIHTCQASGVVLSTNMTCDPNEICQVKNGVMGCYRQQCFLQANGTLTAFSGEVCTITVPGSYEIIQSCDQSRSADWFRVVVKLETCTPGVNTIVAVHVFFNGVMITLNTKHDVWVSVWTKPWQYSYLSYLKNVFITIKCSICVYRLMEGPWLRPLSPKIM